MYRDSVLPSDASDYTHLKKGLEVCIRRLLKNMHNDDLLKVIENMLTWTVHSEINDEALLDFGNVLEYAAMLHQSGLYRYSLTESIFSNILLLIASENLLNSLLGHRVLQHMMDRRGNRQQFDTPRIFFQHTHFNITLARFEIDDKVLMKSYRETIHANLLGSVQKHGKHRINLESTYTTLAMFVVEVPCGYTAASIVCLAMSIQEDAISNDNLDLECSNRIHAAVMSIMSLVCWTHNAEVFYEYLNTILQRRAEFSPHLNPPLQTTYQYARHHILWNKPELFFEDWEVRYGLWKCFRSRKTTPEIDAITQEFSGSQHTISQHPAEYEKEEEISDEGRKYKVEDFQQDFEELKQKKKSKKESKKQKSNISDSIKDGVDISEDKELGG
ncbi:putative transcription initiation factor TFIID subunit [Trypoxylus dichotomus]